MTTIVAGLAVEVLGDGTPVICIHGLGGTSNSFTPQMPALTAFRVIRPISPARTLAKCRASSIYMAAAIAKVMDVLAAKAAHFIGHSLGPGLLKSGRRAAGAGAKPDAARRADRALAAARQDQQRAQLARSGGMTEIADAIVAGSLSRRHARAIPQQSRSCGRASCGNVRRLCPELRGARRNAGGEPPARPLPVLIIDGEDDAVAPPSMARRSPSASRARKRSSCPLRPLGRHRAPGRGQW